METSNKKLIAATVCLVVLFFVVMLHVLVDDKKPHFLAVVPTFVVGMYLFLSGYLVGRVEGNMKYFLLSVAFIGVGIFAPKVLTSLDIANRGLAFYVEILLASLAFVVAIVELMSGIKERRNKWYVLR